MDLRRSSPLRWRGHIPAAISRVLREAVFERRRQIPAYIGLLLLGAGLIAGVMLSLAGVHTIGPELSVGVQQGGKNAVPLTSTLATGVVAAVPFLLAALTGIAKTTTA